jgi:xylan 1,4-beta-xylosidase
MRVPLLPGFHPDPSIVRTDAGYFLVCSTFEYLPGIPVFHSDDLESWSLIGHVATRPGQLAVEEAHTTGGCWAPTIRFRDGVYYLIVTDAFGRGNLVFSATDPAGPWSDGLPLDIQGVDPDLAWDEDGTCYVTFSGLVLSGEESGQHFGIQQVRVNLATGKVLARVSHFSACGLTASERCGSR